MTTDQMTGGSSRAKVAVRDGALIVTAEIAPGSAFFWAKTSSPLAIQDVYREG